MELTLSKRQTGLSENLAQLQKALQSYIHENIVPGVRHSTPGQTKCKRLFRSHDFSCRSASKIGDFDLYRGQLDSAQKKLEEAIRLDPNLPAAQESMVCCCSARTNAMKPKGFLARRSVGFKSAWPTTTMRRS